MKDAESHGYEVLGSDTPTHDRSTHATAPMYSTWYSVTRLDDLWARHLPPQTTKQRTDWAAFHASSETLHLASSFATAADVDTVTNQLMNKIRRAVYGYNPASYFDVVSRGPAFAHQSESTTETQPTQIVGLIPNLPVTSPLLQKRYVHVKERVSSSLLPGDLFLSPAELHKIVLRLSKKKAPEPKGILTATLRHISRRAMVATGESSTYHPPFTHDKNLSVPYCVNYVPSFLRNRNNIDSVVALNHASTVLHYLASEKNCGRYMVALLLDMEKAFVGVWNNGLCHKLLDTPTTASTDNDDRQFPPPSSCLFPDYIQHKQMTYGC
ncbi:hypothetical protein EVAR_39823_1 [Eumeta japonica]|uniref:Uncharacterized protein n=1 Tax=Eumeta variegata TaxID=151549 RepID=A0A4C1X792_EUMVA|nr:hypothetical protein EVAR_39823_1 [Eumeta japonica]